ATFEKRGGEGAGNSGRVSIGTRNVISVRDLATGKEGLVLRRQGQAAALAPDGGRLATAGGSLNLVEVGPPLSGGNLLSGSDRETQGLVHDPAPRRPLMR